MVWAGLVILIIIILIFVLYWWKKRKPAIEDIIKLNFDEEKGKEFLKKYNLNDSFILDVQQLKNKDEYTKKNLKELLKKYDVNF
jgi:hypothetical protein